MSTAVRKPRPVNFRGVAFAALGLAGIWVGLQGGEYRPFGAGLAMFGFFLAASFLSIAGRLAVALKPVVGRTVRVEVWGEPVSGSSGELFDVRSILPLGAGLYIDLREESGDSGAILKVAQPGGEALGDERIEIATASYVQWAGRKRQRPEGTTAPAVVLGLP